MNRGAKKKFDAGNETAQTCGRRNGGHDMCALQADVKPGEKRSAGGAGKDGEHGG